MTAENGAWWRATLADNDENNNARQSIKREEITNRLATASHESSRETTISSHFIKFQFSRCVRVWLSTGQKCSWRCKQHMTLWRWNTCVLSLCLSLLGLVFCICAYRIPGPKFTDDLRTILRQFSDLRQSYDNWRLHRIFTAILRSILRHNLTIPFRRLKTAGPNLDCQTGLLS